MPNVILYTYINNHTETPDRHQKQNTNNCSTLHMVLIFYCYIGYEDVVCVLAMPLAECSNSCAACEMRLVQTNLGTKSVSNLRPTLMGTKNIYETGPNPFILFGALQ